jgi:hypothetical protein
MNPPSGAARRDAGAAAVEFAIIVPVLMVIVMGILEYSFVMRDNLSAAGSVKAAARIASTQAGAGDALCPVPLPEPGYVCAPANRAPALAISAVNTIQTGGTAMPKDSIDYVLVYSAGPNGWPIGTTDMASANTLCSFVGNDCVKFRYNKAADRFQYTSGSWDSRTIDACLMVTGAGGTRTLNGDMASVGVFLKATHPFVTGLFGATSTIESRMSLRFDPLEARSCNGNGIGHGGHQ